MQSIKPILCGSKVCCSCKPVFAAVALKGYFGFFSFLWLSRAISIAVYLKRCEDCWLTKRQNDLAKKQKKNNNK